MSETLLKLKNWDLRDKRVLLRADLNVPLVDGKVINDFRLQAIKPTIDFLLKEGAQIKLITHIGRPEHPKEALSTRHLIPWFSACGYPIQFAATIPEALHTHSSITLLENLRFWKEEREHSTPFAHDLAQLGEYFVNDAFGAIHRNDTSIALLPKEFSPEKRSIGFLVEKEMTALNQIKDHPKHPFVAILGGAKVHDKIPLLEKLISRADTILLAPAIVFTFQKAEGLRMGKSLVDLNAIPACIRIKEKCKTHGVELLFPIDYQIATDTPNGPLSIVPADGIPLNAIATSLGPKTLKLFAPSIASAQTIFFNGVFGFPERKETLEGARKLMEMMAQSSAFSVIAGGDTIAVAQAFGLIDRFKYVSTGGGASLAYIAGEELPGLKALDIAH